MEVLSASSKSSASAPTVPVLVSVPVRPGSVANVIVPLTDSPAANRAIVQMIAGVTSVVSTRQVAPGGGDPPVRVVPGGSGSTNVPLIASDGPALATSMRYVTGCPGTTGSVSSVLTTETSATSCTRTSAVAVRRPGFGSGVGDDAVATLVNVPEAADGGTASVSTALKLSPGARSPTSHTGTSLHVAARVGSIDTSVVPGGSVSVSVTPRATDGPSLVTVIVNDVLGGRGQRDDAEHPGADPVGDGLDRAALPGAVTALEDDADLRP